MQICGANLCGAGLSGGDSYFFSNYGPVWGWASWRRAWSCYDVNLSSWPRVKATNLIGTLSLSPAEADVRIRLYDDLYAGKIDTWDFQWGYAKLINSGLSIIPARNMITNIGFGGEATHTVAAAHDPYAAMPAYDLAFPLVHPVRMVRNVAADRRFVENFMLRQPQREGLMGKLARQFRRLLHG
jgi:hypothetical protein